MSDDAESQAEQDYDEADEAVVEAESYATEWENMNKRFDHETARISVIGGFIESCATLLHGPHGGGSPLDVHQSRSTIAIDDDVAFAIHRALVAGAKQARRIFKDDTPGMGENE